MNDARYKVDEAGVDALYEEAEHWHVNTGGETIHAKRLSGRWRQFKWLTSATWLLYFLGPYVRWQGNQAVLWDIPNRQFHIFGLTILPQDFWMLSLVLLFFAILLAVVTALAGRVWCGYFCFQTVWTDLFTWLEDTLEGPPPQRRKLDSAPWDFRKLRIKLTKHLLWLVIAVLTGISFVAWFTDAYRFWGQIVSLQVGPVATIVIAAFTAGTYVLAGYMREQACFWLCPYARIQGVMVDKHTALPTYDYHRGEPRGRVKKGGVQGANGDCVDCRQCVAVCPTGIDIRHGQQEGCITCGLCIDACDQVMEKVGRPRGLLRYASLDEINGEPVPPLLRRPRVWVYSTIMLLAAGGIAYGVSTIDAVELKVLHERQPLYVLQSDGSIQNRYTLKVLNKTNDDLRVSVTASGPSGLALVGAEQPIAALHGRVTPATVFVRVPRRNLTAESEPIEFHIAAVGDPERSSRRASIFVGPGS